MAVDAYDCCVQLVDILNHSVSFEVFDSFAQSMVHRSLSMKFRQVEVERDRSGVMSNGIFRVVRSLIS